MLELKIIKKDGSLDWINPILSVNNGYYDYDLSEEDIHELYTVENEEG